MTVYYASGANISEDGMYRYALWRRWREESMFGGCMIGTTLFIMLNPSTADATVDDPTIRRCVGFARSWGHNRLEVVNLFAYRATDPRELLKAEDPVGQENDNFIQEAARRADTIVCAWGAMGGDRADYVRGLLLEEHTLHVLGYTRAGRPRHPLYTPKDVKLEMLS